MLYSRIFSYIVLSLLRFMYILHYQRFVLLSCKTFSLYFVRQNMLYFDILGGCIPAVLIVTILQSPYKHDHMYFILIIIIFCHLFLIMFFKIYYFVFNFAPLIQAYVKRFPTPTQPIRCHSRTEIDRIRHVFVCFMCYHCSSNKQTTAIPQVRQICV